MGAGSLLVCYYHLNVQDEYQDRFLLMALVASMAIGVLTGQSFVTMALTTLPWALYFSLALSDCYHLGSKLRRRTKMQATSDTEKYQLCESIEA
jgi:hypothetical protein